jgi:hypothetical protein
MVLVGSADDGLGGRRRYEPFALGGVVGGLGFRPDAAACFEQAWVQTISPNFVVGVVCTPSFASNQLNGILAYDATITTAQGAYTIPVCRKQA